MRRVSDAAWMAQALALAALGEGTTRPNPLVGCVVVKDGVPVGRGFHRAAGEPHAEARALAEAGPQARGATLYVNLEPCAHHGRTGPCAEAIVAAGVEPAVAVELEFSPTTPLAGQAITVTCVSTGDPDAVSFEITQTGGADVNEIPLTGDTIVFTPMEAGTLMFQCVGESADDMMSEPDTISITVGEDPRGGR